MSNNTVTNMAMLPHVQPADTQVDDVTIMIFGASGDLTARKLIPALFQLWNDKFLSDRCLIVGVARREKSDEEFRNELRDDVIEHSRSREQAASHYDEFARHLCYVQTDLTDAEQFRHLNHVVSERERERGLSGRRIVYMAVMPELFLPAVNAMAEAGMCPDRTCSEKLRVVVEKPFGTDLASSRDLSAGLDRVLREQQIFRIDHYLGKETVQNLLLFRFGNSIFEPIFNRRHVDHVQITVAESQGIEGGRGGYYDRSGALRDVLQNHVLQLMCLVAMEPPTAFNGEYIRDEKLKVLHALDPGEPGDVSNWSVAGQYAAAGINGERVKAYLDEDRIAPGSTTETFVAVEARIDNWRWAGVPFYLRTGKRMPRRVSEISIVFKRPPLNLFHTVECEGSLCRVVEAEPNRLVFRIQPEEAISLNISTKQPGMQYQVRPVRMDFEYDEAFSDVPLPEAYERLLLDVMRGDATLFTRSDELEAAWRFVDPVLSAWKQSQHRPELYPAGTWGPRARTTCSRSGRRWYNPG
ncbi:MAG: glucose-6-phosphate dehydrogenase [Planctomycetaceae bacterium]